MFGIDIGITVSSVSCISGKNEVIDCTILFGNTKNPNHWKRITRMADDIVQGITDAYSRNPNVTIDKYVAIEEPVFPYRTRNPKSYFNMCCLYALIRKKLETWNYKIYSIHPLSAKATARRVFGDKKPRKEHLSGRNLNKKGMIRAYQKLMKSLPMYHTKVGQETLADSFFIARTALDRQKVGMKR